MQDRKSVSIIKNRVSTKILACKLSFNKCINFAPKSTIGKNSPTHFLSIPINNDQIVNNINLIQKYVIEKNSLYRKACVDLRKLHLTLLLFHIEDSKQNEATSILNAIWSDINQQYKQPFEVSFRGLDDFHKKVLYASLNLEDLNLGHINLLKDCFKQGFLNQGYYEQGEMLLEASASSITNPKPCNAIAKNQKEFTPHLTIMKMSKMSRCHVKKLKKPHIEPSLYEEQFGKDFYIGKQVVNSIHLSCMNRRNIKIDDPNSGSNTGYYDNLGIIDLTKAND